MNRVFDHLGVTYIVIRDVSASETYAVLERDVDGNPLAVVDVNGNLHIAGSIHTQQREWFGVFD